jgi:hypothetical protein
LAPAICILAGCGAAALVGRISARSPWRSRAVGLVMAAFILVGVLGIALDFRRPYKTREDLQVRQIVESTFTRDPDGLLLVYTQSRDVPPNFLWYFKRRPDHVRFLEDLRLPLRPGEPFHTVFLFGTDSRPADQVAAELGLPELGYRLVDAGAWQLQIGPREQPPASCRRLIRKDAFDLRERENENSRDVVESYPGR